MAKSLTVVEFAFTLVVFAKWKLLIACFGILYFECNRPYWSVRLAPSTCTVLIPRP